METFRDLYERLLYEEKDKLDRLMGKVQNSYNSLKTNNSLPDIRDTNFCSLEPLSEDYEEDTSSEDDGLNMRAIREAAKQQTKQ